MSKQHQLTIYEPEKDPRVVELQINPSSFGEYDLSVYNEDGTVLEDYQLYFEDTNRLIKMPTSENKLQRKWERLKFWKKWVNASRTSNSVVSDVPMSENVHNFLRTYPMNSEKKEKKIAHVKELRYAIAQKKLRRKIRKTKQKLLKKQCAKNSSNANYSAPPPVSNYSAPPPVSLKHLFRTTINSIVGNNQKNSQGGPPRKSQNIVQGYESNAQDVSLDREERNMSRSAKRRKRRQNLKNQSQKTQFKHTSPVRQSSKPVVTCNTNVYAPKTNENVGHDSPSVRWKATEPALDFIPISTDNTPDKSNNNLTQSTKFSCIGKSKNSISPQYGKLISDTKNYNSPKFFEDDFVGISKKAFFLQC